MAPPANLQATVIDGADPNIMYTGLWSRVHHENNGSTSSKTAETISNSSSASSRTDGRPVDSRDTFAGASPGLTGLTYSFNGTKISVFGFNNDLYDDYEDLPNWECFVDDIPLLIGITHSPGVRESNNLLCESGLLSDVPHLLKVTVILSTTTKTKGKQKEQPPLYVDYITVIPSSPTPTSSSSGSSSLRSKPESSMIFHPGNEVQEIFIRSSGSNNKNLPIIIGGVVGGVVLLLIALLVLLYLRKKEKKLRQKAEVVGRVEPFPLRPRTRVRLGVGSTTTSTTTTTTTSMTHGAKRKAKESKSKPHRRHARIPNSPRGTGMTGESHPDDSNRPQASSGSLVEKQHPQQAYDSEGRGQERTHGGGRRKKRRHRNQQPPLPLISSDASMAMASPSGGTSNSESEMISSNGRSGVGSSTRGPGPQVVTSPGVIVPLSPVRRLPNVGSPLSPPASDGLALDAGARIRGGALIANMVGDTPPRYTQTFSD